MMDEDLCRFVRDVTQPGTDLWRFVRKYPDECCVEVSRKGQSQPCDKPAVAVAVGVVTESFWPVCAYHTRGRQLVPLRELLEGHQ